MKEKDWEIPMHHMNPLNEFDLKVKIETINCKVKDLEEFLGKEIKVDGLDKYEVKDAFGALEDILDGISAMLVMTRINVEELIKYPFGRYVHWDDTDGYGRYIIDPKVRLYEDPVIMDLAEHETMGKVLSGIKSMLWMIEGRVCATYACTGDFCCNDQIQIEKACDEIDAVQILLAEKLMRWHEELSENERQKIHGFRDNEITRFRDESQRRLLLSCEHLADYRRKRRTRKWVTGFELPYVDPWKRKKKSSESCPHNPEVRHPVKKKSRGASRKVQKEGK
jgi:hypothetical protein